MRKKVEIESESKSMHSSRDQLSARYSQESRSDLEDLASYEIASPK